MSQPLKITLALHWQECLSIYQILHEMNEHQTALGLAENVATMLEDKDFFSALFAPYFLGMRSPLMRIIGDRSKKRRKVKLDPSLVFWLIYFCKITPDYPHLALLLGELQKARVDFLHTYHHND